MPPPIFLRSTPARRSAAIQSMSSLVAGLADLEAHHVELLQEVVGELDVGLVDLVDEQHHSLRRRERAAERAELDVAADVLHVAVAESAVVEALHGVIHVQALLRLAR